MTLTSLASFTKSLLQHQANPVKEDATKLHVRFDIWKKSVEEQKAVNDMMYTDYMSQHENPRKEHNMQYEIFMEQKVSMKEEWKYTKSVQSLNSYVSLRAPENVSSDIYTRFHLPNSVLETMY